MVPNLAQQFMAEKSYLALNSYPIVLVARPILSKAPQINSAICVSTAVFRAFANAAKERFQETGLIAPLVALLLLPDVHTANGHLLSSTANLDP